MAPTPEAAGSTLRLDSNALYFTAIPPQSTSRPERSRWGWGWGPSQPSPLVLLAACAALIFRTTTTPRSSCTGVLVAPPTSPSWPTMQALPFVSQPDKLPLSRLRDDDLLLQKFLPATSAPRFWVSQREAREYVPLEHFFTPQSFGIQHYDYSKPTAEVYATSKAEFAPKYAAVRRLLDYTWHPYYTLERQAFQDHLVDKVFSNSSPTHHPHPWILFMAGPMGVGKGHVMQYLEQEGWLSLQNWVHSRPDWFREQLPEYSGYLAYNKDKAGAMTQKEVGLIAEVVINEALRRSANVIADGSLRDAEFHHKYFQSLRQAFPHYRIAIVSVSASVEKVKERAHERARHTGRHVPEDLLLKCIQDVPRSVARLAPLADFVCEVDNSGELPVLTSNGLCKGGGCSFHTFPTELRRFVGAQRCGRCD